MEPPARAWEQLCNPQDASACAHLKSECSTPGTIPELLESSSDGALVSGPFGPSITSVVSAHGLWAGVCKTEKVHLEIQGWACLNSEWLANSAGHKLSCRGMRCLHVVLRVVAPGVTPRGVYVLCCLVSLSPPNVQCPQCGRSAA